VSRSRSSPSAEDAAVTLPRRDAAARLLPSGRSIAVSLVLAALALLLYLAARETSMFAVRTIEVEGVRPALARRVEASLRPLEGESLLRVDGDAVSRLATRLPFVAGVSYDRAFPNTLRVRIEADEPLAVLRSGAQAWLVSRRGRLLERIPQRTHTRLPRVWLERAPELALGATLPTGGGAEEVAALVPVRDPVLARGIRTVRVAGGQYVYLLRGGVELRVGRPVDLALKLAIARRILETGVVFRYLDVSVVERPVAGVQPQVSS
jgi:hypothetical protein